MFLQKTSILNPYSNKCTYNLVVALEMCSCRIIENRVFVMWGFISSFCLRILSAFLHVKAMLLFYGKKCGIFAFRKQVPLNFCCLMHYCSASYCTHFRQCDLWPTHLWHHLFLEIALFTGCISPRCSH
jgi:hypothetical protein